MYEILKSLGAMTLNLAFEIERRNKMSCCLCMFYRTQWLNM